jgi:chromosome partitioning protein
LTTSVAKSTVNYCATSWLASTITALVSVYHCGSYAETYSRYNIAAGLDLLRARGAAWCFIDTAPSRTDETAALFTLADLVLVPIRPSPSDLWAASATVQRLKRDNIPFLFILNQIKPNTNITAQAVAALSHHGPVAETFIADRVPYAAAMTDGRTAIELDPRGRAATETAALWKNIRAWLQLPAQSSKKEKVHA